MSAMVQACIAAGAFACLALVAFHHLKHIRSDVQDIRNMLKHHFTITGEVDKDSK